MLVGVKLGMGGQKLYLPDMEEHAQLTHPLEKSEKRAYSILSVCHLMMLVEKVL